MKILIELPDDRTQPGHLSLFGTEENEFPIMVCGCLGKADNAAAAAHDNAKRNHTEAFGDTPLGDYEPAGLVELPQPYGHMGQWIIRLVGTSGEALEAKEAGRTGLAIHAGRGDDHLVPTNGCVRILDRSMALLVSLLGKEKATISVVAAE